MFVEAENLLACMCGVGLMQVHLHTVLLTHTPSPFFWATVVYTVPRVNPVPLQLLGGLDSPWSPIPHHVASELNSYTGHNDINPPTPETFFSSDLDLPGGLLTHPPHASTEPDSSLTRWCRPPWGTAVSPEPLPIKLLSLTPPWLGDVDLPGGMLAHQDSLALCSQAADYHTSEHTKVIDLCCCARKLVSSKKALRIHWTTCTEYKYFCSRFWSGPYEDCHFWKPRF